MPETWVYFEIPSLMRGPANAGVSVFLLLARKAMAPRLSAAHARTPPTNYSAEESRQGSSNTTALMDCEKAFSSRGVRAYKVTAVLTMYSNWFTAMCVRQSHGSPPTETEQVVSRTLNGAKPKSVTRPQGDAGAR
jgi:hypothetical protein